MPWTSDNNEYLFKLITSTLNQITETRNYFHQSTPAVNA